MKRPGSLVGESDFVTVIFALRTFVKVQLSTSAGETDTVRLVPFPDGPEPPFLVQAIELV